MGLGLGIVLRGPQVTARDIATARPNRMSISPNSLDYFDVSRDTYRGFLPLRLSEWDLRTTMSRCQ